MHRNDTRERQGGAFHGMMFATPYSGDGAEVLFHSSFPKRYEDTLIAPWLSYVHQWVPFPSCPLPLGEASPLLTPFDMEVETMPVYQVLLYPHRPP